MITEYVSDVGEMEGLNIIKRHRQINEMASRMQRSEMDSLRHFQSEKTGDIKNYWLHFKSYSSKTILCERH